MNKLDNTVIELIDIRHGKEVKKLFQRNGEQLGGWGFNATVAHKYNQYRYYGYSDGIFNNYCEEAVKNLNLKVITLEEAIKLLDSEPKFIFEI